MVTLKIQTLRHANKPLYEPQIKSQRAHSPASGRALSRCLSHPVGGSTARGRVCSCSIYLHPKLFPAHSRVFVLFLLFMFYFLIRLL